MTTDPKLAAELRIQDQAAPWQPKPATNDGSGAVGSDHSGGFARSVTVDGRIVSTQTGKTSQASIDGIAREANGAANTPYSRAVDGRTSQPLLPHEIRDDSILTFPAGQVTAAQARALGWLQPATSVQPQNTQGLSPLPFDAGQEAPKAHEHPDLKVDLLANEAIDREYSTLVDNTGGVEQHAAIQQIVENGAIDERTLGTLATQLRCEPSQLSERIAPIMAEFEKQARDVMSEGGLDSNDVVAWAQKNQPNALNRAMNRQATQRQTAGYAELRDAYLEGLADHNPVAALSAELGSGITQRRDHKGRIIVRLADGAEMEWKTAFRAFGVRKL